MENENRKIRLLVTDMDGTFLNSSSEIPQSNIDTVLRLKKHDIPTVICTGRPVSFVRKFVHQSGVSSTVISCNGAVIADAFSGEVFYSQNLAVAIVKRIVKFFLSKNIDCLAYTDTGVILFSENSERINAFRAYNETLSSDIEPAPLLPLEKNTDILFSGKTCKILVTVKTEEERSIAYDFLNNEKDVYIVPSGRNLIDIMTKNISKGVGVKKLAQKLNIPLEQVCVAGDNKNDISMFEVAGMAVCMSNGDESAKKIATVITKKTNDDGGFCEIEEFILS